MCKEAVGRCLGRGTPEIEKGGRSGPAACANFSQLCYFLFLFTRFKKVFFNLFCAFFVMFANFCAILSIFRTYFVC